MPSPARRLLVVAAVVAAGLSGLTGCGGGEDHVALAIDDASWTADGELVLRTECADVTETELTPSADGGPPTSTIWGDPKVGRCRPQLVVAVPPGTTKVVDAASSEVVDLPPSPASEP